MRQRRQEVERRERERNYRNLSVPPSLWALQSRQYVTSETKSSTGRETFAILFEDRIVGSELDFSTRNQNHLQSRVRNLERHMKTWIKLCFLRW
jgi:hypothetical protein